MKNTIRLLGVIALAAVIGLGMTACSDGGGSGGGGIPEALIAKWYDTEAEAAIGGNDWVIEITSSGRISYENGGSKGGNYPIKVNGDNTAGEIWDRALPIRAFDYVIEGKKMTYTNPASAYSGWSPVYKP